MGSAMVFMLAIKNLQQRSVETLITFALFRLDYQKNIVILVIKVMQTISAKR